MVTEQAVREALSTVQDPEIHRDLVSLNMVHNIAAADNVVSFTIRLREAGSPLQVPIERRARRAVMAIPGVHEVDIRFETSPTSQLRATTPLNLSAKYIIVLGGITLAVTSLGDCAVRLAMAAAAMPIVPSTSTATNTPIKTL